MSTNDGDIFFQFSPFGRFSLKITVTIAQIRLSATIVPSTIRLIGKSHPLICLAKNSNFAKFATCPPSSSSLLNTTCALFANSSPRLLATTSHVNCSSSVTGHRTFLTFGTSHRTFPGLDTGHRSNLVLGTSHRTFLALGTSLRAMASGASFKDSGDFVVKRDIFDGLTVDSCKQADGLHLDLCSFEQCLDKSLPAWTAQAVRGVWFQISLTHAEWVPLLAKRGFEFHHAQPDYVMMTKWLPEHESSALPRFPFTSVGVGGLVVDDDGRVLLMKERRSMYGGWKYPGGLADPGEDLFTTGEREVAEETGVKVVAVSVLCFRHQHQFKWRDNSDIYFICVMKPADSTKLHPHKCEREAADCRWFSRDEIQQFPPSDFHAFHHNILNEYDKLLASGGGGFRPQFFDVKEWKRTWTMYFAK